MSSDQKPTDSSTAERTRQHRRRSIAIALGLVFMVLLFYVLTIAKLGGHVFDRPADLTGKPIGAPPAPATP